MHRICKATWWWPSGHIASDHYLTMEQAVQSLDPFGSNVYWPLHNVGHYLGRMGVAS